MTSDRGRLSMLHLAAALLLALAAGVAAGADGPLVIADFEDGSSGHFENGTVVAEHATSGRGAYRLEAKKFIKAHSGTRLPRDWSGYDVFKMDVFNPGQESVRLYIQLRDNVNRGYWSWHNRYLAAAPGKNEVQFALADTWRGEILRHDIPGSLDLAKIAALNINSHGPVFIDNIRLEKFAVAKVEVPGLRAFDVGKAGTPGFPGFTPLTEKDRYTKNKGFGWTRTDFARMDDRIHPDNLFRDNLSCRNAALSIDLANGRYRVHLQLEDPSYWELMQFYHRRTTAAEGRTVIDETMTGPQFKKRYFLNQDAEDFPGEDPFDKYVQRRHPWHAFDVEVADGQLNLEFRSADSYGNTLSAVVVYPAEHAAKGAEFLDYVKSMRRYDWAQRWKAVSKPPSRPSFAGRMASDARRDGFALYALAADADPGYDHTPTAEEALTGLSAAAARGEFEPVSFGMRPAKPLGKVTVTVSDLRGPGGATIPSAGIPVRVGRYRFTRHQGHQSGMYSISERELRRFNRTRADELRCDRGMARRFWLTVRPAKGQAAGQYSGTVTVSAEKGGRRTVPLRVTVLGIELPEPDFLFGLYGIRVLPVPYFADMKAEMPQAIERMYRDLRDHGINYLKDSPARVAWQGGRAVITNAAEADGVFAQRKRLGFREGPVNVGARVGLNDVAYSDRIKGLPRDEYIGKWYLEITKQFRSRGWPHPCFCYGDEPNVPETLKALAAAHRNLHEVSPDIWTNIAYHTSNPESYEMLRTLDVHHLKRFCKVEDFHLAKKHGKVLIASNIGPTRVAYGLWSWRARSERKLDGSITYSYTGNHIDIYYGLDGREDEYNMAPPRIDGTFATRAAWERIREGIDDFRYAQALDGIARAGGAGAARARKLLDRARELGGGARSKDPQKAAAVAAWRTAAQQLLAK